MTRIGDIVLAGVVLAIISMLVVPLPTSAIDILIVCNFSISLLLLLLGLYMPSSLSLLSFPTLLLLTTLFRLALNVASARLILSQADAGVVIHAFGTFLIRGELFVGLVIFTIVTIVNFLVIAKGASRVSEVAARFVLDALPGKQASIDSDLRAGLLTAESARAKRDELRKESQLFGAMDGAMKFVQGDAIAGIIIIFVNIIGGLYLGVSRGMELGVAGQTYTVLTVGDGLVSQIPALLISICSGIVVTRVSSNDGLTLGGDLSLQLFANPAAIVVTGAMLMLIGLLPGIPFLPFFGVGIFFLGFGLFVKPRMLQAVDGPHVEPSRNQLRLPQHTDRAAIGYTPHSADRIQESEHAPIMIVLGRHAYDLSKGSFEGVRLWWQNYADHIYQDLGVLLPALELQLSVDAAPMQMKVIGYDLSVSESLSAFDMLWIPFRRSDARALGFDLLEGVRKHPLSGCSLCAVASGPETNRLLEALSEKGIDSLQYIALRAAAELLAVPEHFVSFERTVREMKAFEQRTAGLKNDTLQKYFISAPKLHQVFCALLREQLSLSDIPTTMQYISEFCVAHKISAHEDTDVAVKPLIDHIRRKQSKKLTHELREREAMPVIFTVSDAINHIFEKAPLDEFSRHVAIAGEESSKIVASIMRLKERLIEKGTERLRLVVSEDIRMAFRIFLEMHQQDFGVDVFSAKEFDSHYRLLIGGTLTLDVRGGV